MADRYGQIVCDNEPPRRTDYRFGVLVRTDNKSELTYTVNNSDCIALTVSNSPIPVYISALLCLCFYKILVN